MSVRGPWYITVKAVQDYLRIVRRWPLMAKKPPKKPGPKPGTPRAPHDRDTCECGPCRRWRKTQAALAEGRKDGRSTKTVRVPLGLAEWAEMQGGVAEVLRQAWVSAGEPGVPVDASLR